MPHVPEVEVIDCIEITCNEQCQECLHGPGGFGPSFSAVEGCKGLVGIPDYCGFEYEFVPEPSGGLSLMACFLALAVTRKFMRL